MWRKANYKAGVCLIITAILFAIVGFSFCCAQSKTEPQTSAQEEPPPPRRTPTPSTSSPRILTELAPDADTEKVESDLVTILLTAVNRNKQFVTTLKQDDLRVLEDGEPQQITVFERETERPLSLVILLDASGSQERSLPKQKEAVSLFLNEFFRPEKDQALVASFAGTTKLLQPLTNNVALLREGVEKVSVAPMPQSAAAKGKKTSEEEADASVAEMQRLRGTALYDSVFIATRLLALKTPPTSRRAIILLTDGDDSTSHITLEDSINAASYANTAVYSIGIGDTHNYYIEKDVLRKLSEDTGGRAFFPKREDDLRASFTQLEQELRSQYVIAYAPTNRARDGQFRQITIEIADKNLSKEKLKLQYRKGYYARKAPPAKTN